ncbi:MAG: 16S rRNA (adenine(1518)-N(6)/adenine(1519)-N(6))-dimethyltransferase RsmA [Actinomycetota bacterium]|nr:16S rRNA (adenine(1518)-N(6)/adenine(1519)-N(6))-dimethyltransferase RsmA [Actinomycetota bacterium]
MTDPRPPSRRELRELLRAHDIQPSRSLGQNFLVDANMAMHIARLAGVGPGMNVLEIGAGVGALTGALAATGAGVTAVEIDRHLLPLLSERVEGSGVRVVEGDAMVMDLSTLVTGHGPWHVVANLPYNVATPLVLRLLESVPLVGTVVVMVQAEVGERLVAKVGSKAYGAVSVRVAYFGEGKVVARVGPDVFLPRPKVTSTVVRLTRRPAGAEDETWLGDEGSRERIPRDAVGREPAPGEYSQLVRLVRAGFGHRRKMLKQSLGALVTPEQMAACGIPGEVRAEELDLGAWRRLARWTIDQTQS